MTRGRGSAPGRTKGREEGLHTSLNNLECWGANSFILSTVGLWDPLSEVGPHRIIHQPDALRINPPDPVPELRQPLLIFRIESEFGLWIDNDSWIKPSATEHHHRLDVRIRTKNTLWGLR